MALVRGAKSGLRSARSVDGPEPIDRARLAAGPEPRGGSVRADGSAHRRRGVEARTRPRALGDPTHPRGTTSSPTRYTIATRRLCAPAAAGCVAPTPLVVQERCAWTRRVGRFCFVATAPRDAAGSRSTSASPWPRPSSGGGAGRTSSATSTRSRWPRSSTAANNDWQPAEQPLGSAGDLRGHARAGAGAQRRRGRRRGRGNDCRLPRGAPKETGALVVVFDSTAESALPGRRRGEPAPGARTEGVPRRAGLSAAARPRFALCRGMFRRQRTIRADRAAGAVSAPSSRSATTTRRRDARSAPSNCSRWRRWRRSPSRADPPPAVRRPARTGRRRRTGRVEVGDRDEGADDAAGPRPLRADRAATCGRRSCAWSASRS